MKPPQDFLPFFLKVITQEIRFFCGKVDTFFPSQTHCQRFVPSRHKHLNHEARPFLQALPSHRLPVYNTVFKSGLMSFTDGQEQGVEGDGDPEPEQK